MESHAWTWTVLLVSLWDGNRELPGPTMHEWLPFVVHDWDEVDSLYLEGETIGGG